MHWLIYEIYCFVWFEELYLFSFQCRVLLFNAMFIEIEISLLFYHYQVRVRIVIVQYKCTVSPLCWPWNLNAKTWQVMKHVCVFSFLDGNIAYFPLSILFFLFFFFFFLIIRHGIHYVYWPYYEHVLFPLNLYVIIEVLYMLRFIWRYTKIEIL